MSVTLFACGILLAAAGAVAVGFAFPISDLPFGSTILIAGSVAIVGGLQMLGLAAVVAELAVLRKSRRLTQSTAAQPTVVAQPTMTAPATAAEPAVAVRLPEPALAARLPEPVRVPEPVGEAAAPPASVDVSTSVIERLRSNIPRPERTVPVADDMPPLSPNGNHSTPAPVEPVAQAPARAGNVGTTVEAREPRLDFLFRQQRQTKPAPAENFDTMWPKRPVPARGEAQFATARDVAQVALRRDEPPPVAAAPAPAVVPAPQEAMVAAEPEPIAPPPAPALEPSRAAAILKSGVVDGMAYTLYADGSIEAQLPQGTVRFGSIAELRAHIENNV